MRENYLLIILDSVRYDKLMEAVTPTIDSIGEIEKVYSPACWTIPSLVSLFIIPSYIGHRNILKFSSLKPDWIPLQFKEAGYYTLFSTSNAWVKYYEDIFSRGFDEFLDLYNDKDEKNTLKIQIEEHLKRMKYLPYFHVLHVMETHVPYYGSGGRHRFIDQVKSIEYVDSCLKTLLSRIPGNTVIILTSDHGEYMPEKSQYHNPFEINKFSIKLFEVPLVIGRS